MREFRAEVAGGGVAAWQAGAGPAVLILHGGPGLSDYTAPLAAEFTDSFRVIRYQQRGLAPSTTSGPFDIGQHVADAIAVLDAAEAERAYVIGHSWGGHLALHLALHLAVQHQERLLGLVLADPLGAIPDGGVGDLDRNLTARIPPGKAARARELDERAMAGQGTAADAVEGLTILWPGYFSTPEAAPPMPALDISVDCYAATFASILEHFERKTLEQHLPALNVPTVFVLGADSPIPPEHGLATAALIPGARCRIEPECGHFAWLERPGSGSATSAAPSPVTPGSSSTARPVTRSSRSPTARTRGRSSPTRCSASTSSSRRTRLSWTWCGDAMT
jgi:pimeloyl-ACP methyl ester carboxylesterase